MRKTPFIYDPAAGAAVAESSRRVGSIQGDYMDALRLWWGTLFAALAVFVALQVQVSRPPASAVTVPGIAAAANAEGAISVNGSRAPVPPVRLRVSGDIVGLATPDASATVTVRYGSQAVAASVDGNIYSASILAEPEMMVRVEVDSLRVHYRSLLGSAALLKRRSGGDGQVVVGEHASLRVSPMSTAIAFLSNHVLQGREPGTDAEVELAWRGLGTGPGVATRLTNDLTAAAHVLAQVANGEMALPAGFATGYQLLQDAPALLAALDQDGTRAASLDYPFRTAEHVALGSLSDLPEQLLLMQRIAVVDIPNGSAVTQLLVKKPMDRFDVHLSAVGVTIAGAVPAPSATPEYDATITPTGDLLLIPNTESVMEVYGETGVRTRITMHSRTLRRLTQGQRHDLWASRADWEESYPDNPAAPPAAKSSVEIWSGASLAAVAEPVSWSHQSKRVALPSFCMSASTTAGAGDALTLCETVPHRFDVGGTGVTEDAGWKVGADMQPKPGAWGSPFTWTLLDGQPQMRVVSGDVAVDYWIIDEADGSSDLILFKARNQAGLPAGQTLVGVVLAVTGDYVPYTSANAPGTWRLASNSYDLLYPEVFARGFVVRLANATASEYLDVDGLAGTPIPSNWLVTGERLYDVRYRARFGANTRYVQDCTEAFAAGATACAPWRIRYFRPLARSGSRIYGISDFYFQTALHPPGYAGPYAVTRSAAGSTYYDCTDGTCLSFVPAQISSSMRIQVSGASPIQPPLHTEERPAHANLRIPMRHLRPELRSPAETVRR